MGDGVEGVWDDSDDGGGDSYGGDGDWDDVHGGDGDKE